MISVILPVFRPNREHLETAIASVLQAKLDLEVIVVEDRGETSIEGVFQDPRMRYLVNPRPNRLGAALNFAIANARGSLIARMDADDVAEPDRFSRQLAMFDADPSLTVVGSQLLIIGDDGIPVGRRVYPTSHARIAKTLTRYNCVAHPSVMFRREAFEKAGGYAEGVLAEDYDLWCRLLNQGARFSNDEKALVRYRFHEAALKYSTVREALIATIELKERNFGRALDLRARARIAGERLLLKLPGPVVIRLFAALAYRRL